MTMIQVKNLLQYLGYYEGIPDGEYDDKTRDAVFAFQTDYGTIGVDGIPGPEVEMALRDAVAFGMPVYEVEEAPVSHSFWEDIEYFERKEFRCKCGGKYCNGFPAEPQEGMVRLANDARKHFGAVGRVVSGLRCEEWNRIQGGTANSQHMYGEAVDLKIEGVRADKLLAYINKQTGVRYAYKINSTNVHIGIPYGKR